MQKISIATIKFIECLVPKTVTLSLLLCNYFDKGFLGKQL